MERAVWWFINVVELTAAAGTLSKPSQESNVSPANAVTASMALPGSRLSVMMIV